MTCFFEVVLHLRYDVPDFYIGFCLDLVQIQFKRKRIKSMLLQLLLLNYIFSY